MTVSSVATGYDGISLLAGNAAYDPAGFFLIQRVAGTGSSENITFTSIPSNYKHLQIRGILRGTSSAGISNAAIRLNSDTTEVNYASHHLGGDGGSVFVYGSASGPVYLPNCFPYSDQAANVMGVVLIDIHDYASTTKYKTIRNYCGIATNSGVSVGAVNLGSGLWENTNAVSSLTISGLGVNFTTSTTFALYGMVG
jgi:hypothetical protein